MSEIGNKVSSTTSNVSKRAGIYPIIIATCRYCVGNTAPKQHKSSTTIHEGVQIPQDTKGSGALAQSILIVVPWRGTNRTGATINDHPLPQCSYLRSLTGQWRWEPSPSCRIARGRMLHPLVSLQRPPPSCRHIKDCLWRLQKNLESEGAQVQLAGGVPEKIFRELNWQPVWSLGLPLQQLHRA